MEQVLQALLSPRRREILRLVRSRERSAGEIHRALGDVTFGAVSQHLGVLQQAGLVCARREGRSRFYATRRQGLQPLREWLDAMWTDALARLGQLAEADASADARAPAEGRRRQRGRRATATVSRSPVRAPRRRKP